VSPATQSPQPPSEDFGAPTPTPSLQALRTFLEVGIKVGPAVARRAGLSHSELDALEALMTAPRGPVELARDLGVTSAASSGIVDRLEARGHVTRRPHPSDGRRTEVVITDSARQEVLGHLLPMLDALSRMDQQRTDQEREVVTRYLEAATEAMRTMLR